MTEPEREPMDDQSQPDLNAILEQAMAMQERLLAAQADAQAASVDGTAGGGLVRVTFSGDGTCTSVHIRRDAVDPDDVEMLEDLVLAAIRDAQAKVHELQTSALGGLAGLGDLGGLGKLLGGP